MRWRGPLVLGAVWVVATCLATAVGLAGVRLVAGDIGGSTSSPLSSANVHAALADMPPGASRPSRAPHPAPPTSSRPRPSTSTKPAATGSLVTARTKAGVVSARCVSGAPRLLYAVPADGWRTESSDDGEVSFTRSAERVTVHLWCQGRQLQTSAEDSGPNPPMTPAPSPAGGHEDGGPQPSESPSPNGGGETQSPGLP